MGQQVAEMRVEIMLLIFKYKGQPLLKWQAELEHLLAEEGTILQVDQMVLFVEGLEIQQDNKVLLALEIQIKHQLIVELFPDLQITQQAEM